MFSGILLYKLIIAVAVFAVSLGVAAYATYGERKIAAFLQDRIGPNRAGIFGLLQPIADGVKMITKEEFIPAEANKWLFILGPCIAMFVANMSGVVIPWARPTTIDGQAFTFQITDINVGILWVFGIVSIGVYGIMIGGWSSNNKYSLLGALRASSQMISYELAMGLSLVALIMTTGTLSVNEIVEQQGDLHYCNFVYQPLGFLIFLICAFAETNRAPFDLPETETELVGGYHTEYSSMKLGFYLFSEYINMFISSAVMASLYFGGYHFPFEKELMQITGEFWIRIIGAAIFLGKVIGFILFFMWVRWSIPRFRYDQLMNLGWKTLLPLSIANLVITGIVVAFHEGWFNVFFK